MKNAEWRGKIKEMNRFLDFAKDELTGTFDAMLKDLRPHGVTEMEMILFPVTDAKEWIKNAQNALSRLDKNANDLCKKEEK